MAHYANGEAVCIGDLVVGTAYNTPGEITGTVVGFVPGQETSNLRVAFVQPVRVYPDAKGNVAFDLNKDQPRMSMMRALAQQGQPIAIPIWGGAGTPVEPPYTVWPCVDYGDTRGFKLIARADPLATVAKPAILEG